MIINITIATVRNILNKLRYIQKTLRVQIESLKNNDNFNS